MSAKELGTKSTIRRTATSTLFYKLLALAAALIWGTSFVVMKDAVDTVTTSWLLAMRFIGAGVILGLFIPSRIRRAMSGKSLLYGSLFGALLFVAYWTQTVGLTYTTPGKNAFLTAVYCIIVPFGWWLVARKKPTVFNIVAAVVCLVGLSFVSLDGELGFDLGERWTLVSAVFYAAHLMCVSKFAEGRDIYVLTMIQFLVAGLLALLVALTTEPVPAFATLSLDFWFNLAFLTLFASLAALLFQNIALKHVPPAQASLLLSLESVFGVLASVLFYGETLTIKLVLGFSLIFIGIVISETGASYVSRTKRRLASKKENRVKERNAHRLNQNVIMIGMPGSGKSTVGKALAKRLGKNFRDGDDVIREQMGCTLEDIMNERGPMGFLTLEEEILSGVELDNMVFAPGGSCAYEDAAMAHLAENATVVYLLAGYDDISSRVGDLQKRGVVLKDGIGMSLQVLYDERHPLYEKFADVIVDETGLSINEAADAVERALATYWEQAE